ncbi:hypothetical protein M9H77_06352 [Catharanthus roseus]|uniref:Uncharacterized protein n=1 Tax=Catharanthus roseus TaxID=4058 RepID=A0ACC0BS58_CATRO|nr:hypothetical protein M9H77_06352 [Catharanthus roseus]
MEMMASMQAQMNNWFDALDGKISDIQERTNEAMWISKGMKKAKQKGSFKFISLCFIPYITRLYEDKVIKLKTLKTRRIVRDSFIKTLFGKLSLKN